MDILFGRNQFPVIISFFICGILLGIIYDVLKIKRRIFGSWYLVLLIDDLIFMLTVAVVTVLNAYSFNNGNMKWYETPTIILGFWTYRKTLSVIFIKICFYIIDKTKIMLEKLLTPVYIVVSKLKVFLNRLILLFYTFKCKKRLESYRL